MLLHATYQWLRLRLTTSEPIWKRRFHSENTSNVFRPHYAGEIWKRRFHSENTSNVFRPHYAGEIWKRCFHSENTSNVFRPHYAGAKFENATITGHWICVWGKLGQGNHVIIVTSSFSKSYVFSQNVFHPYENAKSAICWRAFLKSSISETD